MSEPKNFIDSIIGELESPGKGRKICNNCSEYTGARSRICKCGYSFEDKTLGNKVPEKKVVSATKTFDGPGRGRRQCTSCKKYVGARSIDCPICGVEITKVEKSSENVVDKEVIQLHNSSGVLRVSEEIKFLIAIGLKQGAKMIYAPVGSCPFKLDSSDKESVYQWSDKVLKSGTMQGVAYLPQAIKYWLRFQFPIGTKEYETSSRYIDEWANELQDGCEVSEDS